MSDEKCVLVVKASKRSLLRGHRLSSFHCVTKSHHHGPFRAGMAAWFGFLGWAGAALSAPSVSSILRMCHSGLTEGEGCVTLMSCRFLSVLQTSRPSCTPCIRTCTISPSGPRRASCAPGPPWRGLTRTTAAWSCSQGHTGQPWSLMVTHSGR